MKKIWDYFVGLADSLGRARAAAELSRRGQYEAARYIMESKKS